MLLRDTKVIITNSVFIKLHGLIKKACSWRMAIAGEPSFELFRHPRGTVLSGWFSILIFAMHEKRKELSLEFIFRK
jgi:hypothetical protein